MTGNQRTTIISGIPLFSCLADKEIATVAGIATECTFQKNTVIIHASDVTTTLFVIVRGKADAVSIDPNGKQIILNTFGDGDYFGEMSFIDGEPRSASVVTKIKTRMLMIPREQFVKILAASPDLAFRLMKGVILKLRKATLLIEDLAFKDVYGRIVRLFYQEADRKNDKFVIREKLTHQEIANRIGSSREMVSRILKELEEGEYISKTKGIYKIEKQFPYSW